VGDRRISVLWLTSVPSVVSPVLAPVLAPAHVVGHDGSRPHDGRRAYDRSTNHTAPDLCVPNTHPIRSRHESVLVNESPENLATS
jgi:hypothetical protein